MLKKLESNSKTKSKIFNAEERRNRGKRERKAEESLKAKRKATAKPGEKARGQQRNLRVIPKAAFNSKMFSPEEMRETEHR